MSLSAVRAELRQRRHHRAFRIGRPQWTEEQHRWLQDLATNVAAATKAASTPPPAPRTETADTVETAVDDKTLASTATSLWRALRKLDSVNGTLPTAGRHAHRYLRSMRNALADAGLVIHDHDGQAFHPGLLLEVLVREDAEDATAETVSDTVRPTIYLHDRRIQLGQVIVAGPPASPSGKENPGA